MERFLHPEEIICNPQLLSLIHACIYGCRNRVGEKMPVRKAAFACADVFIVFSEKRR